MLKIKINNKNLSVDYTSLVLNSAIQDDGDSVSIVVNSLHREGTADVLSLIRRDNGISYEEERSVMNVSTEDGFTEFTLPPFDDIDLWARSSEIVEHDGERYLFIVFDRDHYLNVGRDFDSPKYITEENDIIGNSAYTFCEGDVIISERYFAYRYSGGTFEELNHTAELFWERQGTTGITDVIIPVTFGGNDMRQELLVPYNDVLFFNLLSCQFRVKDRRFFDYTLIDENYSKWALSLMPGADVRLRTGDPELELAISKDFSTSLLSKDSIGQFLENDAESKVTAPVDYEKQQFTYIQLNTRHGTDPVVSYTNTDMLRFNVFLRDKDEEWNTINDTTKYWAQFISENYGDCISRMGFDWEDIYYQRKKVTESFLRLSFYDTPSRGNQQLLYTVKLYIDANKLWHDYVDLVEAGTYGNNNAILDGICLDTEEDSLRVSFTATNKYDYNHQSEGFYLHLFPGNVKDFGESGATIYMKAELNNAKYGKVVPLTMPTDDNGNPLSPTNENPVTYTTFEDGDAKTDMARLQKDMYLAVMIRYNAENKRYEWGIDNSKGSDVINLYEPLIVKYK